MSIYFQQKITKKTLEYYFKLFYNGISLINTIERVEL